MLTLPLKFPQWFSILFCSGQRNEPEDATYVSAGGKMPANYIKQGAEYVSKALSFLAGKDALSSCRIHREFVKLRGPQLHNTDSNVKIYLVYLWESAEKIIESSRHISTNPNHKLGFDMKSEINALSDSIAKLSSENILTDTSLKEEIEKERDFIQFTIAVRSKEMKHEDFNDGTLKYTYLTLLYHLHSYLNAASRIISH